ncbi:MAG: hypothetical protein K5765_08470 [Clostridia bacterium]|nr:hypothetical protein [Clostridia bacterium]
MKKIYKILIISMLLVLIFSLAGCNKKKINDEPLEAKEIAINSAQDLIDAKQYVGVKYKNYTIKLYQDIDLSEVNWTPFGISYTNAFMGTFDGNGKTISNLTIKGWDEDGQPLYIAKRVLGYKEDGSPVYKSSDIISVNLGTEYDEYYTHVNSYVFEGDNSDPNYVNMSKKGTIETGNGNGSVGFFGFLVNATVKDLTIDNADISYYEDSSICYGGVLSGFESSCNFTNVKVKDSSLNSSLVKSMVVTYHDESAQPKSIDYSNSITEYKGTVVGYSMNSSSTTKKEYNNVISENCVICNNNYVCEIKNGFSIVTTDLDENEKRNSYLVKEKDSQKEFEVTLIKDDNYNVLKQDVAEKTFISGLVGFSSGVKFTNCSVTGINKNTLNDTYEYLQNNPVYLAGRNVYLGGLIAYSSNCEVYNCSANGVYMTTTAWNKGIDKMNSWYTRSYTGYVFDSVTAGGLIGCGETILVGSSTSEDILFELGGNSSSLYSVTGSGIIGYINSKSIISNCDVTNLYVYSSYTGFNENLGSSLAGICSICYSSNINNCNVENINFDIDKDIESYVYSKAFISRVYGDSSVEELNAKHVYFFNNNVRTIKTEKDDVIVPNEYKNNYVIEDGLKVSRIYRFDENGNYGNNYVSVYGELNERDTFGNAYISEELFVNANAELEAKYNEDDIILENDIYYYYSKDTDSYNSINDEKTFEEFRKYKKDTLYVKKNNSYKYVEFKNNSFVNGLNYYEYNKENASLDPTTDNIVNSSKKYYVLSSDIQIDNYQLKIKLYSKSNNIYEFDNSKQEDSFLSYNIAVNELITGDDCYAIVGSELYELPISEIYYHFYFEEGKGFKVDENNYLLSKDVLDIDFSSYKIVIGRPTIKIDTLNYNYV